MTQSCLNFKFSRWDTLYSPAWSGGGQTICLCHIRWYMKVSTAHISTHTLMLTNSHWSVYSSSLSALDSTSTVWTSGTAYKLSCCASITARNMSHLVSLASLSNSATSLLQYSAASILLVASVCENNISAVFLCAWLYICAQEDVGTSKISIIILKDRGFTPSLGYYMVTVGGWWQSVISGLKYMKLVSNSHIAQVLRTSFPDSGGDCHYAVPMIVRW